ncbi:hypothetical protein KEM56_002900 [Ascosphaera pollenicola]|nr:hypothetical protein KEM56_002900 [Ascosphaera pollenicola]
MQAELEKTLRHHQQGMHDSRGSSPAFGGPGSLSGGLPSPGFKSGGTTPVNGATLANGGIASPGLGSSGLNGNGPISWESAKAKSDAVRGYPSFSTRNNGFFSRQRRKISASLPRFRTGFESYTGGEKDQFGGFPTWNSLSGTPVEKIRWIVYSLLRKKRVRLFITILVGFLVWLFLGAALRHIYQRSMLGHGKKIVLIVASNVGGGVMELKGAREWAIERESLKNKRKYVEKWGYDLEIVNMMTKKRYAHEWRESWEKVDVIRGAMRKYPHAEWFWWMDLNTFIMEPSHSIHSYVLSQLDTIAYRDINQYNPLNITHPPTQNYLDPICASPTGDNKTSSINMVISQDCGGFNLGSFLIKRSAWTDRLLDIWWDPVMYEQRHMNWERKEQSSLEHLYTDEPWVRPHIAFLPQRRMNSFPPGACGDGNDPRIHYNQEDRDFVVNMSGCEFGRDCWAEMYSYRTLSNWLNRTRWERFKEHLSERWKKIIYREGKVQRTVPPP